MNLAEIGTRFEMPYKDGKYIVTFPQGDHLIVCVGADYGTAGAKFNHPKVAIKASRVFELKHYHPVRGKFWTARAGIDFSFVIPKKEIELVEEHGYSYPKIIIGGEKYTLSVTGGTFPSGSWTDTVHQGAHMGIKCKVKTLKHLAEYAISPELCEARGIQLSIKDINEHTAERFVGLAAKKDMQKAIKINSKIMLGWGCYWRTPGNKGPFPVVERRKRKRTFTCVRDDGGYISISYNNIDWTETAKANGIELVDPCTVNRIGGILEPDKY